MASPVSLCVLGGAPAWPSLLQAARAQGIALAPTYGMTETASQVVTLSPPEFEAGQTGCGRVLPHAQIEIGEGGAVRVRSRSLAQGYLTISASGSESSSPLCASFEPFPQDTAGPYLPTDDLGFLTQQAISTSWVAAATKLLAAAKTSFPLR
ncbi:MAG: AMP-binding protein [Synechococcales cyanobacterium CRU_2_2]|nr:AMP-binding protein [Synechococcales cyanobacterium CRU_2_2]